MAGTRLGPALLYIQRLFSEGSSTGVSDTQLLSRFATGRDESAFAALLARHGPMVMTVCRGVLRNPSDAEDAFQATFLVLARKAGSAWGEGQLGGWLHRVAYRIAVRAVDDDSRRHGHERRAAEEAVAKYTRVELDDDLRPALHEEIARLPVKFRLPIVLCYLEGLTHAQAAVELQCGEATLRRRLAGARVRLSVRLARRGFVPIALAVVGSLANKAGAAVPAACAQTTIRAAKRVAAGEAMATVVSARVASLTQGGLTVITKGWKATAFAALSLAAVAGLVAGVGADEDKRADPTPESTNSPAKHAVLSPPPAHAVDAARPPLATGDEKTDAQEKWPLTLAEAVGFALDNDEGVRVLAFGAERLPGAGFAPSPLNAEVKDRQSEPSSLVIMPLNPRTSVWRFKSRVMVMLRVVEQQYWSLAHANVTLSSSERATSTAREIHKREQAELKAGRGTVADVAEAAQRLEQFNLDLVTRTSDVMTTERQLRDILGLPSADNRRIIPITPPTEARLEPDWETSVAEMKEHHPDIALLKLAIADLSANARRSLPNSQIEALNRDLQQVVHQTTHSLARFFLEIDANYKQFKTASRLRAATAQRLDAQRAYHEEGRITIDRLLDTVSQYATAVATEAQFKTTYNVSICALEEAKGTLLAYDNITVVEEFKRSGTTRMNENRHVKSQPAAFETPTAGAAARLPAAPVAPPPVVPVAPQKTQTHVASGKPSAAGTPVPKAWSFSFSIGRDRPFLIKGTITEGAATRPDTIGP